MARRPFPWLRVATLAVVLGAAGLVLWISGRATLQAWISITGVGITACVVWVVKGLTEWRSGIEAPELISRLDRAAADLAAAVQRTWSREAAHRGLTAPLPIAVPMRFADPRISAHPAQWASPAGAAVVVDDPGAAGAMLTDIGTDVAVLYDRVTTGRLVILGDPGGGKTGAAVLLLLALCAKRRPDGRIPVWFPLASWEPHIPVEEWMSDQLATTYGIPITLARQLVNDGRILPFLDGLDEIPADRWLIAMAELRSLDTTPLVLTCRTVEYTAAVADRVLAAAAVVEVIPVDPATAAAYLTHSGAADAHRWDPLIAALDDPVSNPCQQVLRSPLMLSLARTLYQAPASDPAELTAYRTAAQLEDRLLDAFITAVYGRDSADTTALDARRWLSFFADNLPTLGPGGIAWWRLPYCVPKWGLRIAAGLAAGLAAALWAGFVAWFSFGINTWPYVGLVIGLLAGLAGVIAGVPFSTPSQWRRPRWRDLAHGLKAGVRAGLVGGLVVALVSGITIGTELNEPLDLEAVVNTGLTALSDGLVFGLIIVAAAGLITAFRQQRDTVTPLSAFRTDIKAVVGVGVIGGLVGALAAPLALGLTSNFWLGLTAALVFGLPVGLGSILWLGLRRCSAWWYGVAVVFLARRGAIPVRSLRFLEDAYRRGVLRQTGMVYEFRHARLAQRLRSTP